MSPLLIAFAAFGSFWLVGLAGFSTLGLDTRDARITLSAPAFGSAVILLPLFVCSYAGLPMHAAAPPVVAGLCLAAAATLAARRPPVSRIAIPVVLICLVEAVLIARPFFSFGFHWFANANDDMANYVLSATHLLSHGLLGPVDFNALAHDRGYTSSLQELHNVGSRPGADISLGALASVTGLPAYDLFMPFIFALQLVAICAAASLALTSTRRAWAAILAAALLAVSPLAALGMLQQLLPQVWGLGLAAALFAFLLKPALYRAPGGTVADVVVIGVLTAAVIVVYVELASTLVLVYALFIAVLACRREISLQATARLWVPSIVFVCVVLNGYLLREVTYVINHQANSGFASSGGNKGPDIFGYSLVPTALGSLVGLEPFRPIGTNAPYVSVVIAVSIVAVLALVAGSIVAAARGHATAVIVVAYTIVGLALAYNGADFGQYKLFMYVQPFIAAAVASWFARGSNRQAAVAAIPLLALAVVSVHTQQYYVSGSRSPIDLRHASNADLIPAFTRFYTEARRPVISVTENPVLAKLEAAVANDKPLYFVSSNIFGSLLGGVKESATGKASGANEAASATDWRLRTFNLLDGTTDQFAENQRASSLITSGDCELILPTGTQQALNRRSFPEGSPDIVQRRCGSVKNFLLFQNSNRGNGFYSAFRKRKDVTFYQLESDIGFAGTTFSGVGRYLLFRVLGPTQTMRVAVTLTETPRPNTALPPAWVIGSTRERLHFDGSGSGRTISGPIRPQMIGGVAYVMLDLGRNGTITRQKRTGLVGLYGKNVILDPRFLTSYLRDVSILTTSQYRHLSYPSQVDSFPRDLRNPDLQYSGIFEDGWLGQTSSVTLRPGPESALVLRATTLPIPLEHLTVLVNGVVRVSRSVPDGTLALDMPIGPSRVPRTVVLRWTKTERLSSDDPRQASAHLSYLGLASLGTAGSANSVR